MLICKNNSKFAYKLLSADGVYVNNKKCNVEIAKRWQKVWWNRFLIVFLHHKI